MLQLFIKRYRSLTTTQCILPTRSLRARIPAQRDDYAPRGRCSSVLCVVDNGVVQHHATLLADITSYCRDHQILLACAPLVIAGGEQAKNDSTTVALIQEAIHHYGLCRHSYVLAIAAEQCSIPWLRDCHSASRLASSARANYSAGQNDSGVGVKNGINAFGKKNFLGTFAPPVAVFNDAAFLTALHDRDGAAASPKPSR